MGKEQRELVNGYTQITQDRRNERLEEKPFFDAPAAHATGERRAFIYSPTEVNVTYTMNVR